MWWEYVKYEIQLIFDKSIWKNINIIFLWSASKMLVEFYNLCYM